VLRRLPVEDYSKDEIGMIFWRLAPISGAPPTPEPVSLPHGKTQGRNFFEGLADEKTTANHGLGMGTQ
jgi:hypothetical protein